MSLASLFQLSRSGVLTKKKPAFHFDCAILFPFFVEDIEKKDFKKKEEEKKDHSRTGTYIKFGRRLFRQYTDSPCTCTLRVQCICKQQPRKEFH